MKLTAKIKLNPDPDTRKLLHETLQRANAACNAISEVAWENKLFSKFKLHHLCYYDVRQRFELSAQVVIRALGKVADGYKLDRKTRRAFRKHGAFPYDNRILKFRLDTQEVSIWTLAGRRHIPFQAGQHQLDLLQHQQGESDLAFIRGEFYLFATCDMDDPATEDVSDYMGVDLGIVNIATTDDGERHSGTHVNQVRHRNLKLRQKLQQKGRTKGSTKSAKRLLKKRSGRERRFVNDVNHCISKAIVKKARSPKGGRIGRGISLEDLTDIRKRVRLRKPHRSYAARSQLHSWSFADLGMKIKYKAQMYGVPVVSVDPRNTSKMCSACGGVDRSNRKSQSVFECTSCGFSAHADVNAATNIGRRASVNAPHAVTA